MRVALIDYGAGNLRSASRALAAAGVDPIIVSQPAGLAATDTIVVPGVGAFAPAMRRLAAAGLVDAIQSAAQRGVPLVGICLGMQLLFDRSEEGEPVPGLSLLPGIVRRLPESVKVPHMGWNTLEPRGASPLFAGLPLRPFAYFVHSYIVRPADPACVAAETEYGTRFASIVHSGRIWGLQFHPEKSSAVGARLLRNLLAQIAGERRVAPRGTI
ncbi:MAG: imidazole glycerol phosphate synthase subunit HisH [Armatimonadota bacterium]|nr:imidazole glycerol phosphate synthase subunit HisH [Armatimonadota bacterium]